MSSGVLALLLALIALFVTAIVVIAMQRKALMRRAARAEIDRARCLELSTQWNHTLLEQVAQLSKQSVALRHALIFYSAYEHWTVAIDQDQSLACKDRGQIARMVLGDLRRLDLAAQAHASIPASTQASSPNA